MVLATTIWGSLHPMSKLALRELGPIQVAMFRVLLAGLTLTVIMALRGQIGEIRHELRVRPATMAGLGLLSFFLSSGSSTAALFYLPASVNSLLVNVSPLFVALGLIVLSRGRVHAGVIVGVLVGLIGLIVVVFGENTASFGTLALSPPGVALALVSSATWAAYIALGQRVMSKTNPHAVVVASSVFGLIPWLLITGFSGGALALAHLPVTEWLLLLYVGIIGTGLPYLFWTVALTRLSTATVAVFQYTIPFWAIVFSALLLGEPITVPLILGGAGIVAGIAITQRAPKFPEKAGASSHT